MQTSDSQVNIDLNLSTTHVESSNSNNEGSNGGEQQLFNHKTTNQSFMKK